MAGTDRDAAPLPDRPSEQPAADRNAVRRMAAADPAGLAELYDRHARLVFSLALRIVEEWTDAEDVVQEVFAQAWRQASRFDASRGSVAAWLLTIARSRAIDAIRARRARPDSTRTAAEQPALELADPAPGADAAVFAREQVETIRTALNTLPALQRVAIEMAFYKGLTQAEIAEQLEQPLGTVKTRIRLGLLKLRDAIARTGR